MLIIKLTLSHPCPLDLAQDHAMVKHSSLYKPLNNGHARDGDQVPGAVEEQDYRCFGQ